MSGPWQPSKNQAGQVPWVGHAQTVQVPHPPSRPLASHLSHCNSHPSTCSSQETKPVLAAGLLLSHPTPKPFCWLYLSKDPDFNPPQHPAPPPWLLTSPSTGPGDCLHAGLAPPWPPGCSELPSCNPQQGQWKAAPSPLYVLPKTSLQDSGSKLQLGP